MTLNSEQRSILEEMFNLENGFYGHTYFTNSQSSTAAQKFYKLEVLANTTLTYTEANSGTFTDKALLAGDVVVGNISSIAVTTGSVRAYFRNLNSLT